MVGKCGHSLTGFVKTLQGVNVTQISNDLERLGYLCLNNKPYARYEKQLIARTAPNVFNTVEVNGTTFDLNAMSPREYHQFRRELVKGWA